MLLKAEVNLQLFNGASRKLFLNVTRNMTTELNTRLKDNYGMTMVGQAVEPDILIRSGHCWELTNLGLKRTADGFFVLPT